MSAALAAGPRGTGRPLPTVATSADFAPRKAVPRGDSRRSVERAVYFVLAEELGMPARYRA